MDNSQILKEIQSIQKQGNLNKQSRFLKSWRQRWVVITTNLLLTYKERRKYESPTQIILLKDIISIKTSEQQLDIKNAFKVQTNQAVFYFTAETAPEKQAWIGSIGKAMVRSNNIGKDFDD